MPIPPTHLRAAVVAAAVAACFAAASWPKPPVRPNVLIVVMDTTRADRCSLTGYARPTTPRLDEFAKDAVVFEDAWSPANWTGPAHATLFTGSSPAVHGFNWRDRGFLDVSRGVLAERFAAAGYETACFTNNPFVAPSFGLTRGFARFDPLFLEHLPAPRARATHDLAASWAEAAAAAGRPFFLFVNDMESHLPYSPGEEHQSAFVRGDPGPGELGAARECGSRESIAFDLGIAEMTEGRRGLLSDLYDATIHDLDGEIGRLLDRLRDRGLLESTVVVVVGDHGESIGEHHLLGHTAGLYRQVLHVPLLVRLPGRFDGGRRVTSVVRLEDVAPTLLELCGLLGFAGIDGVPLTRDLDGRVARAAQPERDMIFERATAEFPGADATALAHGLRSVHDGKFHLVARSDGRRELYDVARDPGECDDLASREPDEVRRLEGLLGPP